MIATKVKNITGPALNDVGLGRKHILAGVEQSLKKLQTHYIDLYQVPAYRFLTTLNFGSAFSLIFLSQCHSFDNGTPLKETFSTLNDLVRIGKVHYIGVSNFNGSQLQKAIDLCNYMGLNRMHSLPPPPSNYFE